MSIYRSIYVFNLKCSNTKRHAEWAISDNFGCTLISNICCLLIFIAYYYSVHVLIFQIICAHKKNHEYINPFTPGDFTEKTRFEGTQVVFWPLSCYKELKLTTNLFTGRTLHGLLIQMQNMKFGHAQKAKFRDSFWV